MKAEVDMFGKEVPDKKIKDWEIPLPPEVVDKIRERARRVLSSETKHDSGGYQGLVLDLESFLMLDCLSVDYMLMGRILRQAYTKSDGGWESECRRILRCIGAHFSGEEAGEI